jgi:hypothetical protein
VLLAFFNIVPINLEHWCCASSVVRGVVGLIFLGNLEIYVYWVEVCDVGYFRAVFGCVVTFLSELG